jgi:hypothetical protein
MFEKRVLTRIFGTMRKELTEIWRKFCADRLNDFFSTPNIISLNESRRSTCAGYIVKKEQLRNLRIILV